MTAIPDTARSTFDGCSGFISFFYHLLTGGPPPCEGCCDSHDWEYSRGGALWKKFAADVRFYLCERKCHGRLLSSILFLGVTFGGLPWIPFPSVRRKPGQWKRRWQGWQFQWTGVRWGWPYPFPQYREGSYAVALLEFAGFVSAVAFLIYVIL